MIARIIIPILLAIVLTDVWFYRRYLRRRRWWWRVLWLLPGLALAISAVALVFQPGFLPVRPDGLFTWLFFFGLIVVPKAIYALWSGGGRIWCRLFHKRRNYANLVGLLSVFIVWYILFYGTFVGFSQLKVKHVELYFTDLPKAFDGYRILQFSDAHVGTLTGERRHFLERAVDTMLALKPDMIVFTGDLQNTHPQELYPHRDLLARLKAPDGVYSVLGNHDYADYVHCPPSMKVANCRETQSLERQMGWTLLMNEHRRINRNGQSLVVAGMENDGDGPFPQLGDVKHTMEGVSPNDFVVMLEHDPTAWQRKILPQCQAQLTLSGHTHAGQFMLLGWSPVKHRYREWSGLYHEGNRQLYVSTGLGGLIPFRFGVPGEIVVITLRLRK